MPRLQFDAFAKACLVRLLPRFGALETSGPVPAPPKEADGWFLPGETVGEARDALGLLGDLIQHPCVLETYSTQVSLRRIQPCFWKQQALFERLRVERKQASLRYPEADWPRLILFFPSVSSGVLEALAPEPAHERWPQLKYRADGVYCSPRAYRTLVVVTERLPVVEETLLVRLLFSDLAGMRKAWKSLPPGWAQTPGKKLLLSIALDYKRHIESNFNLTDEEAAPMWNVPEIPHYTDMLIAEATQKVLAEQEGLRAALQAEQERRLAEQEAKRLAEQEGLRAALQAEQEGLRAALQAEQESQRVKDQQTLSILLSSRFPGINGEQAVLERFLLGLGLPQATRMVLTLTLPELLDAAAKASESGRRGE